MEGIFEIKPNKIKQVEMKFNEMYRIIQQCTTRLESVCSQLDSSEYSNVISAIQSMKETCDREGKSIKSLNEVLMEIVRNYENVENNIVGVLRQTIAN